MRANHTESYIERNCVKIAKARGCLMPKWTSPGTAGVHDRLLFTPHGDVIPIEFKTLRGKLTKLQQAWHRKLELMSIEQYTVHSIKDFEDLLDALVGSDDDE